MIIMSIDYRLEYIAHQNMAVYKNGNRIEHIESRIFDRDVKKKYILYLGGVGIWNDQM